MAEEEAAAACLAETPVTFGAGQTVGENRHHTVQTHLPQSPQEYGAHHLSPYLYASRVQQHPHKVKPRFRSADSLATAAATAGRAEAAEFNTPTDFTESPDGFLAGILRQQQTSRYCNLGLLQGLRHSAPRPEYQH